MQDQKLMDYFKFDEGDLQANRNGSFSGKQKNKLSTRQTGSIKEKRIAVVIAFPLSIGLLVLMGYLITQQGQWSSENPGVVFWLGLCGVPMLLASLYIFRISFIRQKYNLKRVEGPINIVREVVHGEHGHTSTYHELHIGGKEFNVDESLADMMMQGDTYAIYYSEGSVSGADEVLSAELISKGK